MFMFRFTTFVALVVLDGCGLTNARALRSSAQESLEAAVPSFTDKFRACKNTLASISGDNAKWANVYNQYAPNSDQMTGPNAPPNADCMSCARNVFVSGAILAGSPPMTKASSFDPAWHNVNQPSFAKLGTEINKNQPNAIWVGINPDHHMVLVGDGTTVCIAQSYQGHYDLAAWFSDPGTYNIPCTSGTVKAGQYRTDLDRAKRWWGADRCKAKAAVKAEFEKLGDNAQRADAHKNLFGATVGHIAIKNIMHGVPALGNCASQAIKTVVMFKK